MLLITQNGYSPIETWAARMYGEEVQSATLEGIADLPRSGWMPVGSVAFCRAAMAHQGLVEPEPLDYPECIAHFAAAGHFLETYADVPEGWTPDDHRVHAKPYRTKLDPSLWTPETPFWIANWHRFGPEYRFYIRQGEIVGCGRYDDRDDDPNDPLELDMGRVLAMVNQYQKDGAPAGYGLDVGVSDEDGLTYLVKVIDGWALGWYRGTCHPRDYLSLLEVRWQEIRSGPG
ncbi:conserved hypothetical protein [Acidithiobacillus caldus SM-1]|uniref:ATP-grasp domain-containing protein n=1 Tax=Acidithiobacillus caldus (strain SM-1) TaxID=990288 RepID=F9ZQQ0_ACICS|nr:ATP-grasp domain-containing protein [Acidithiobacillus caldus]AEK58650.1 conserved hypothetical protein [Acidithiobacillus caldus SM-1]